MLRLHHTAEQRTVKKDCCVHLGPERWLVCERRAPRPPRRGGEASSLPRTAQGGRPPNTASSAALLHGSSSSSLLLPSDQLPRPPRLPRC
jgi:hypothetical protein